MSFASLNDLPRIGTTRLSQNQTSHDRTGGNYDGSDFLYTDDTGKVMLDVVGPGVVQSFWVTGFGGEDRLKVYFDGELEPRIDIRFSDLFSGAFDGYNGQFCSALVGNNLLYSGGFVCYVPLPFAKSIKISTDAHRMFYHQFRYDVLPVGSSIVTWTQEQDNSERIQAWSRIPKDPKRPYPGSVTTTGTLDLVAGSSRVLLDVAGPRIITSIALRIPSLTSDTLNKIRICAKWDASAERAIDAPLGSFFGIGSFGLAATEARADPATIPLHSPALGHLAEVHAVPLGYDAATNTLYMFFPMPFLKHAEISLCSIRNLDTSGIQYELAHAPFQGESTEIGYLKTAYTLQDHEDNDHTDLIFLDMEGSGALVGIVDSRTRRYGDYNGKPWMPAQYLEGDERIYVDGSKSPCWYGTGTEDFYNGGWYFNKAPYTRQPSGCVFKDDQDNGTDGGLYRTVCYRMLVEDSIPFRTGIRFGMEHGFGWGTPSRGFEGEMAVTAETLVFYYHNPDKKMLLTDALDIGDASSEEAHQYTVDLATSATTLTSTYEGAEDRTPLTDSGRGHRGGSQFQMEIFPDNSGVLLRRRFDQATGNQAADISVDGELVGRWYVAGCNGTHRWRDTDYVIPASFTQGKGRLEIRMQFVKSDTDWNEYRYEAFSLK